MNSSLSESIMTEEGSSSRGRMSIDDGNDEGFKSKNLNAERRRREKLRNRLHELRALVPIITNMNKATIITDAITYIEQLQNYVTDLSNQLMQLQIEEEDYAVEPELPKEVIEAAEEMRIWGIEPEVIVTQIDATRLWVKIVYEKKRGRFTKLVEAVSVLGYEFTDTSVTTSKGAILVTSCLLGDQGGMLEADQIREMLVEIIEGI